MHRCLCVFGVVIDLIHDKDRFETPERQAEAIIENSHLYDIDFKYCMCVDLNEMCTDVVDKCADMVSRAIQRFMRGD